MRAAYSFCQIFNHLQLSNMKVYIVLLTLFTPALTWAQISIGVMNQSPEGVFHVDAATNNGSAPAATKYQDDVIFTSDGFLGIRTNTPQNIVDVRSVGIQPALQLEDGTQTNGYMLTSDAEGYASWKEYKAANSVLWYFGSKASYKQMYFTETLGRLSGATSAISGLLPGFVHNANSTLKIPKGKYILVIHGDIFGNELGQFGLYGTGMVSGIGRYYLQFWYQNYLNASSVYLSLGEDVTMEMHGCIRDSHAQYWGAGPKTYPNNWYGAFFQISIIRLK